MEIIQSLLDFFSDLQSKDWITLVASLLALSVSLLSYKQKSNEGRLALRKQLTDLFEKLTELNTETAMYRLKERDYPTNYSGLLNDKRRFLVRQANFLVNHLGDLVSPYEYLLIAGAYDEINDTFQAEAYFGRAIGSSSDSLDKGIAVRGYARYLFNQGPLRHVEARAQYEKAVSLFCEGNDRHRNYLGDTYTRWARQEREWMNLPDSVRLFELALTVYKGFANPERRRSEVAKATELVNSCQSTASTAQAKGDA